MHFAPKVSVVMSVFNAEPFLKEAVESILTQTFEDFEFIVIDDGSTDACGAMLAAYAKTDSRMQICHQANQGLINSLNRGCSLAKGQYIARMDADDISLPHRLTEQISFMEENPKVAVVGSAVQFIDRHGRPLSVARNPLRDFQIKRALVDSSVLWHPSVVMRRHAYVTVGGYRSVVDAEDYDLWLRMAEHFELGNLPAVLLKYRLHGLQVSVARCESQALGVLTAKASAELRRAAKVDPVEAGTQVTPSVLFELGFNEAVQRTALARTYLSCFRNMCRAREYASAMSAFEHARAEVPKAERWMVADLYLWAARLYWRTGKIASSVSSAVRAVVARPVVLGRPLKAFVTSITDTLRSALAKLLVQT